ncbi:hypothetical protein RD110_06365 [Rhodoferax koreense]|uniref:Transmembrane protein n=1 Tax=Rhodoferax koreensis TaxID=1842727 RepID=A0A1P8JSX8_9BURK|nr:hypothetical protein [Rhodoferax koreense]APW36863.1 hypothetical protein RD110_06365 [Rhodoferax koreense]
MYLVVIAWIYVALMMSVAEATNTTGTVLGGVITFVLYGAAPVALVVYLMGSPGRRRRAKAREAAERARAIAEHAEHAALARASGEPDAGGHAAGETFAPVRKEP